MKGAHATLAPQENVFCSETASEVTLGRELKQVGKKKEKGLVHQSAKHQL